MPMGTKIFQVDAFTDLPFSGNPAAVCILEKETEKEWMQNIAAEMNLSETAFLISNGDRYNLRWFTPTIEVDLCGHATLASAHILWEEGYFNLDQDIDFITRSGVLTVSKIGDLIEMNFPSEPEESADIPQHLKEGLGVNPIYIGKNRFDYLVEVESEEQVRNLNPDYHLLSTIDTRGIIVTSNSESEEYDFVSRFFAPSSGINEDPVTGSAHCCLGPFWGRKLAKKTMTGYQDSKRGGVVHVTLKGDRVLLGGRAVTIFKGELL